MDTEPDTPAPTSATLFTVATAPVYAAPENTGRMARYACWSGDLDVGDVVATVHAHGHESAATSYLMQVCSKMPVHENPPSPETILVIDLESGESRFVQVRLIVHIVDSWPGRGS